MILKENALMPEDYQQLRESVGWRRMNEQQVDRALRHGLCTLAAFEDGIPVGMGRLVGDGLYDTIVDVVVRPEYQGRGIGRAIVEQLLNVAGGQTPPGGRVSVQLISETGREAFYERLGFRRIPHENCGSGMRRVIRRA